MTTCTDKHQPKSLRCDCCGQIKLAERHEDGRIVVRLRKHGETHTLTIDGTRRVGDNLKQ